MVLRDTEPWYLLSLLQYLYTAHNHNHNPVTRSRVVRWCCWTRSRSIYTACSSTSTPPITITITLSLGVGW